MTSIAHTHHVNPGVDHWAHAENAKSHVSPATAASPQRHGGHGPIVHMPKEAIDSQGGVHHGLPTRPIDLAHYAAATVRLSGQRPVAARRTGEAKGARKAASDEEKSVLQHAVKEVLEFLQDEERQHSREDLQAALQRSIAEHHLQPAHQMNLLVQAFVTLGGDVMAGGRKGLVSRVLRGMSLTLMKQHPDEIRALLQGGAGVGQEGDPMQSLVGATNAGVFNVPLRPVTLLTALIRTFGPDCIPAMRNMRSHLVAGL